MHDYTARILHEDRMKGLRHEADGARLAAQVRHARQTRPMATASFGWLTSVVSRTSALWRSQAQAYRFRGRLGPTADAQLGEDV
jgi:hypothetical protein